MRNTENINKIGMREFLDDKKIINRIKNCIVSLFTKQKILNVWNVRYKWLFDEQWNFVEWVICVGNSVRRTWKFYTVVANWKKYDVLKEGKREYNSGLVEEWKFGEWEVFLEWERLEPNGVICRWLFDINTWRIYDWEMIFPDWQKRIVKGKYE